MFCIGSIFECADSGVATPSGGGIDVGNPAKLSVVDSLNQPVSSALVKIISAASWYENVFTGQSVVLDSAVTNDSGKVCFDSLEPGTYNIQVDHESGGAFVAGVPLSDSSGVNTVTLSNYGSFTGTISGTSGQPHVLRFTGTDYSTIIAEGGACTLPEVAPATIYPVVMSYDSSWALGGVVEIKPSATTGLSEVVVFNALLIDDFEDSASTLRVGRSLQESYRYTYQGGDGSAVYTIVHDAVLGSSVLHSTIITAGRYALIGFHLGMRRGIPDSCWDFSAATALTFMARGKGTVNVSVESDTIDKMGEYKHYGADFALDSVWRRCTIPFDSLRFNGDGNPNPLIGWPEAARTVKRIEFNALEGDTIDLWLDDLSVEGIDISTVY